MNYAVFRLTEWGPPHRTTLAYGRDDTSAHVGFLSLSCNWAVVEKCPTIRVASASVGLRNAVQKELASMIAVAVRRGAPPDLIEALNNLQKTDPSSALDMGGMYASAKVLLSHYGIDLGRSWSDDLRVQTRLGRKLEKYQIEVGQ